MSVTNEFLTAHGLYGGHEILFMSTRHNIFQQLSSKPFSSKITYAYVMKVLVSKIYILRECEYYVLFKASLCSVKYSQTMKATKMC